MFEIRECILYREFENGRLLERMTELMEKASAKVEFTREDRGIFFECLSELVELAGNYGFSGNLWHNYLTFLLVNHENVFSTSCEIRGRVDGSLNPIALHDFLIFKRLYDFDLGMLGKALALEDPEFLTDFQNIESNGKLYNERIRDRICTLSKNLANVASVEEFLADMVQFYKDFGVGKLGLHKAFRVDHDEKGNVVIEPITRIAHVHLDELVGYELQKQKLIENTEAFVSGRKANNCLLFGDAGTGKSTSVKAILNQYYDRGLRIIEVYKHQFQDLNEVIALVKNRNYKFIIYMDDLSFEEFETEYKYLKAVIEGGLERKPENILIYATSNRRHLVRERASDKLELMDEEDLHSSDTVQEKLSLVYRFGVQIYFSKPEKKEFQEIVRVLAARNEIHLPEETLLLEANKWEISHGGMTGRTAQQFIDYLLGKETSE